MCVCVSVHVRVYVFVCVLSQYAAAKISFNWCYFLDLEYFDLVVSHFFIESWFLTALCPITFLWIFHFAFFVLVILCYYDLLMETGEIKYIYCLALGNFDNMCTFQITRWFNDKKALAAIFSFHFILFDLFFCVCVWGGERQISKWLTF